MTLVMDFHDSVQHSNSTSTAKITYVIRVVIASQ